MDSLHSQKSLVSILSYPIHSSVGPVDQQFAKDYLNAALHARRSPFSMFYFLSLVICDLKKKFANELGALSLKGLLKIECARIFCECLLIPYQLAFVPPPIIVIQDINVIF